jgi:RNA cap guanine-N2 methyltransferase
MDHNYLIEYNRNKSRYLHLCEQLSSQIQFGGDSQNHTQKAIKDRNCVFMTLNDMGKYISDEPIKISKLPEDTHATLRLMLPPAPPHIIHQLIVNMQGAYSITCPANAKRMMNICKKLLGVQDLNQTKVTIATAGIGGEVLNFMTRCLEVVGYEYSAIQYSMLVNNVHVYLNYYNDEDSDLKVEDKYYQNHNVKLMNEDFIQNIERYDTDILIVDPPWGGMDYKDKENLVLTLGEMTMTDIAVKSSAKACLFKLPFNHDLKAFYEIPNHVIKVFEFRKYMIVTTKRIKI